MSAAFAHSSFNQDISKWNVSKVKNMEDSFMFSDFNQDISKWNVKNVINMSNIFSDSQFNQDISCWNAAKVKSIYNMFENCNSIQPWWFVEYNFLRKQLFKKFELMIKLYSTLPEHNKTKQPKI